MNHGRRISPLVLAAATAALALTGCTTGTGTVPSPVGPSGAAPSTVASKGVSVEPTAGLTPTASASVTPSVTGVSPTPSVPPSPDAKGAIFTPDPALAGAILAPGATDKLSWGGAKLLPTAQGPLSGKTIVVDPGHNRIWDTKIIWRNVPAYKIHDGKTKCQALGATGPDGVTQEPTVVWQIGLKTATALRAAGATVIMTRINNDGYGPCNSERAEIANRNGADLLVSLHADGARNKRARGFSALYSERMFGGAKNTAASKQYALDLVKALTARNKIPPSKNIQVDSLPVRERSHDLAVLNGVGSGAAVLVELGFMSNKDDFALMTDPTNQDAIAKAFVEASVEAVGQPVVKAAPPKPTSTSTPSPTPIGG